MDIHSLMNDFSKFDGAKIGFGPLHPLHPQKALAGNIKHFLDTYPFLEQDEGYIQFLQLYAGASIFKKDSIWMVDILGFTDNTICSPIAAMEGDIIDEYGFLMYSYIVIETRPIGSRQLSFAFDSTIQHPQGIYRVFADAPNAWHWYCPSFLIWLERLIACEGRLDS